MATFDQLPAEQRAILELVLQRGQSYADLGGRCSACRLLACDSSPARPSESPRRGAPQRVNLDWRGQVADYLLGQQTGPEGTATRGHLKRSEPARLWALSLLDSLDHLYDESDMPVIPEGDAAPPVSPSPGGGRAARAGGASGRRRRTLRDRVRAERPVAPLSADAETIVRRRRIAGGAAAATALLFMLLVWPIGLLTGDDDDGGGGSDTAAARPVGAAEVSASSSCARRAARRASASR